MKWQDLWNRSIRPKGENHRGGVACLCFAFTFAESASSWPIFVAVFCELGGAALPLALVVKRGNLEWALRRSHFCSSSLLSAPESKTSSKWEKGTGGGSCSATSSLQESSGLAGSRYPEKSLQASVSPASGLVVASRKLAAQLTHLVLWCWQSSQDRFMEDTRVSAQEGFWETRTYLTETLALCLCYI